MLTQSWLNKKKGKYILDATFIYSILIKYYNIGKMCLIGKVCTGEQ